jgi:hypothetical protein
MFAVGLLLSALGIYFFFDSVLVTTAPAGWISGMMGGRRGGGGLRETTSMGIIFVPFLISVIVLFYNARIKWAWWLLYIGIAVIAIEILSRIRFFLTMKTTHLLGMMVLFAAGIGLMIRSYRQMDLEEAPPDEPKKP